MDVTTIRDLVTLFSFVFFLVLAAWTWMPARRPEHDDAAQLVFEGELDTASHRGGSHE